MPLFTLIILWPVQCFIPFQNDNQTAPPWVQSPFEASPQSLVEAAEALSPVKDQSVDVLLSEQRFRLEDTGSLSYQLHRVYRVLTKEGVDEWSSVYQKWSPWYQNRPEIRVRISNPDGSSQELDPATLQEAGDSGSDRIYKDVRSLRAPYPNVTLGSVIEERVTVTQHQPFFDEGEIRNWYLTASTTQRVRRLILDFPEDSPIQFIVRPEKDLAPRITNVDGRRHMIFELLNTEMDKSVNNNLPFHQPRWPYLAFTTGTSWKKVARLYARWVEDRLKGEDFDWLPKDLIVAKNPRSTAFNFMQWLNNKVRYTGMELGEAALIPASPSETLARGFGDCKDKATTLVGMLRKAGFKANVALLRAGYDQDADPELPGMGRFNHAIVVVPGKEPIWMDPTEEFLNNTLLPMSDQGRWALIAAPKTKALVKTPEFASTNNWVKEKRTYILPDTGESTAAIEIAYGGALETDFRQHLSSITANELKEDWTGYVNNTYHGAKIEQLDFSDPKDAKNPFIIKMNLTELGRGVTIGNNAAAAIRLADLFDYMPSELKTEGEPRGTAFLFPRPFKHEIELEMIPPDGFTPTKIPESGERAVGSGTIGFEFEELEGNRVLARVYMDSGKRLLQAEEFETYRSQVRETLNQDGLTVSFHHEGEQLLSQGHYRKALDRFRELAQTRPDKEIHQIRLARAYLTVGLGQAARAAARRATEINPQSVEAYNALGFVLQHDVLGRKRYPGFDLQGAVAAYERAIELDEDHFEARGDLAILLEYDELGYRYNPGANLEKAINHYRYIRDEIKNENLDFNLYTTMAFANQFDELLTLLGKTDLNESEKMFRILAITGSQGREAGYSELTSLSDMENRETLYVGTGGMLVKLGLFHEAVAFFRKAARGSEKAMELDTQADLIERVATLDSGTIDTLDPIKFSKAWMKAVISWNEQDVTDIAGYLGTVLLSALDREKGILGNRGEYDQISYLAAETPVETIQKIGLAVADYQADGAPQTGYKVDYSFQNAGIDMSGSFYLAPIEGRLRLAAVEETLWAVGVQALEFLKAGNLDACATWLGWAFPREISFGPQHVLNTTQIWKRGDPPDKRRMEIAALSLYLRYKHVPHEAIARMETLRNSETEAAIKDFMDLRLSRIYFSRKAYDRAGPIAERLYEKYPEDGQVFTHRGRLLVVGNKFSEAQTLARKHLEIKEHRLRATQLMADVYTNQGKWNAVREFFEELESKGRLTRRDFNHYAWYSLFGGLVDDKALTFCRRGVKQSSGNSYAVLHTLATLYAEVGRCKEAREILFTSMKAGGNLTPKSDDWLVLGRIAEKYGEWQTAREAYERVEKQNEPYNMATSSYVLAKKWLAGLPQTEIGAPGSAPSNGPSSSPPP